jgi:hypothetical protein
MQSLAYQRCFNHGEREAAARCPECGQFFCRECITEHEDRVICAACLGKLARIPLMKRKGLIGVRLACQCLLGVIVAWFFFYLVGESLLALPTSFHEGKLWQTRWLDKE